MPNFLRNFLDFWETYKKWKRAPWYVIEKTIPFDSVNKFTPEDEAKLVNLVLSKTDTREIIEKYIQWRVGIDAASALRSTDDVQTARHRERAFGVGQITIDWQNMWKMVHLREEQKNLPAA